MASTTATTTDLSSFTESLSHLFDSVVHRLDFLFHTEEIIDGLSGVPVIGAGVVVVVGGLCIVNGYRWHKWVVALLALIAGLAIGYKMSEHMGRSNIIAISIGALCGIIATPLLKVTVAIFGGLTGALVGANCWTALDASPAEAHWAGALIGFAVVAMASMILFRLVIVLFTSIGGAAMIVFGGITLLLSVPGWEENIRTSLISNQMLIPMLLLVTAVSGFVIQQSRLAADGVKVFTTEQGAVHDD